MTQILGGVISLFGGCDSPLCPAIHTLDSPTNSLPDSPAHPDAAAHECAWCFDQTRSAVGKRPQLIMEGLPITTDSRLTLSTSGIIQLTLTRGPRVCMVLRPNSRRRGKATTRRHGVSPPEPQTFLRAQHAAHRGITLGLPWHSSPDSPDSPDSPSRATIARGMVWTETTNSWSAEHQWSSEQP